jgi:hypothetical protein
VNTGALPVHLRIWRVVATLDMPAFLVGGLAAIASHRWGAYVLIGNAVVQIGFHLIVGARAYHEVMTRPWPHVAPLEADDWDE